MSQRTLLEDELAKYSTPMYRAPEMLGINILICLSDCCDSH